MICANSFLYEDWIHLLLQICVNECVSIVFIKITFSMRSM